MSIPYPKSILVVAVIVALLLLYALPTSDNDDAEIFDVQDDLNILQPYIGQRIALIDLPQAFPMYLPLTDELRLQDEISPQCTWHGVTLDNAEQVNTSPFIHTLWFYDGLCGGGLNRMQQTQSNDLPQFQVDMYYVDVPDSDICVLRNADVERAYLVNGQAITRLTTSHFADC